MARNESGLDRIIRLVVGLILIALAFGLGANSFTVVLYVAGIVALVTAATGFCALYKVFGINTNKK
ncbi:MAG: DUF2892 domain-containing protein [Parcubacteria group bacterium]|jgi:hypothetical protein